MGTGKVAAVDLFCGAGGLSWGLRSAGIDVTAGIDIDPNCRYPFETNIKAKFVGQDVTTLTAEALTELWNTDGPRVLAGCAPCQPFSPYRRGADTSSDDKWPLLSEFGRLVSETLPEIVTMENVPRIGKTTVFLDFVAALVAAGYHVDWRSCACVDYGLPQTRRRLVLIASRLGPIYTPDGPLAGGMPKTVRQTIEALPSVAAGESDPDDPLHRSRRLSDKNMKRIRASQQGGTWEDWPKELRAPCHRKKSGATFRNVYARMSWDDPAPTITTLCHNFGAGRFGHPEQDRPITLREAAMLQGFPAEYKFVKSESDVYFSSMGRLIGNAVPPPLGESIGTAILDHLSAPQTASAS